jgi:hypothetical protein
MRGAASYQQTMRLFGLFRLESIEQVAYCALLAFEERKPSAMPKPCPGFLRNLVLMIYLDANVHSESGVQNTTLCEIRCPERGDGSRSLRSTC